MVDKQARNVSLPSSQADPFSVCAKNLDDFAAHRCGKCVKSVIVDLVRLERLLEWSTVDLISHRGGHESVLRVSDVLHLDPQIRPNADRLCDAVDPTRLMALHENIASGSRMTHGRGGAVRGLRRC